MPTFAADPLSDPARDWWRGGVIYQIYPRSFRDLNGDGIGDLAGIAERLDYIAGLGVDGIWLSPFFTSPMCDFGYDIADYTGVDPMFGTLDDFDRLVERARSLGLKVVVDQVYSHTSDRHAWFAESRASRANGKSDWYVWADPKPDGTPPNNWLSVFGGPAWSWEPRRKQYYLNNFLPEQPDLNLHNAAVQDALLDVARFWLDRGVDGFRLDVANFYCHDPELRDNPPRTHPDPVKPYWLQYPQYNRSRPESLVFVARLRRLVDSYEGAMTVAEIASDNPVRRAVEYSDGPDRFHTAYSFVFLRQRQGADHIRQSVEDALAASATAWPSWSFSNHDVMRVVSRWGDGSPSTDFAKLMIAVLTCLRGTIFLYQGEELGLPEADVPYDRLRDPEGIAFWPDLPSRDGARTPMPWSSAARHAGFSDGDSEPWLPVDPRHRDMAVDRQEGDAASVLTFTQRWLAWRRTQNALVIGDIVFHNAAEPLLAFSRRDRDGGFLCIFNLAPAPITWPLPQGVRVGAPAPSGLPGTVTNSAVHLPGYGGVIARLE